MVENISMMGIYGLYENDTCVYVGSSINIKRRFYQHKNRLKANKHANFLLQRIYNKHGEGCLALKVLETVDNVENLINREQFYIDSIDPRCNLADANGGHIMSEEAKEKMRNHVFTEEHKKHLSESHKGKDSPLKGIPTNLVPKTAFKKKSIPWNMGLTGYSTKQKGTHFTEEHKKHLSEAKMGKKRPDISDILTGRKMSEETKQKISKAVKRTKALKKEEKLNVC